VEKILFTSDQHTGHRAGLTPPKYQSGGRKWVRRQAQKWEWYESVIDNYGPFSCHINLGDVVDGLGVKDSSETIIATNDQIRSIVKNKDSKELHRLIREYLDNNKILSAWKVLLINTDLNGNTRKN